MRLRDASALSNGKRDFSCSANSQNSASNQTTQVPPDAATLAKLPEIDPSKLTITQSLTPKPLLPPEKLVFGRTFTDHMLSIEWTATEGWLAPRITPYQNLSLDPATSVLHYCFSAFEGLKAYRDKMGNVRLFRPDRNMVRLNRSSASLALPQFSGEAFIELMKEMLRLDARFIPQIPGYSLYLRPTMIGTQRTLGVGPSGSALLYLIASPVGPYYPTGFKAITLAARSDRVRAWPGGVGDKKLGANYAPCIVPQMEAAVKGHQQNLWLVRPSPDSPDEYISEVGTMNIMVAWKNTSGGLEIVTPPLDGTILEGVTRDSVLTLARERLGPKGWTVTERPVTMGEVAKAADDGRLIEVFGTGTAAVVAPIRSIEWQGRTIDCGLKPEEEAGELASSLKMWIEKIMYGEEEGHPWSWKV